MKKILLLLLLSVTGFSQTLDPTFDTDGIASFHVNDIASKQLAYDAALQADGKLVCVGKLTSPFTQTFISRYNTDGSKDYTFNQSGFLTKGSTTFQTVAIQNDDKLVVAGLFSIFRFLTDGSPDLSFNSTGFKTISFNNQNMNINNIEFQTNDKVIVSGYISNGTNNDFAIAQLNSDGTLDTTFDTDGILILAIGTANDQAYSHKIQNDGKIVVFGETFNGTNYDFVVARINSDGTLDTSFGSNGKVTTTFTASSIDRCFNGGILSDGRIIAFGNSGGYFAFTRYTTTGALDTTFDTDGKLTLIQNITTPTAILATTIRSLPKLIILSDDKFIVSGTSDNDYKVIKLFNDGYVTSFGTYGSVTVNDNIDVSSFLLEKSNGNLITGGYSSNTSTDYKIKKIELYNNGYTLTTNYLSLILSYEEPPSRGNIIKLVDGSYIIPIGINPNVFSGNLSLIKILADGNRDMTFGNAGNVELDYYNYEGGLILLPDGKIIVRHSTKLYKMDLNGILDTSFGVGGIVDFTTIGNGQLRYIDDFILSNDNKLLLACDYNISPSKIITAVVKLNLDGSLDNTFGINGVVNYGFNPNAPSNYSEYPSTLVQDANNKIVVASISSTSNFINTNIYFSNLNADGSSDSTFGSSGIYTYTTLLNNTYPKKICVTSDNNYLVSYSNYNITTKSNTLKINTNGGIYNSFGINGLVEESDLSLYRDMLIQPDNKILKGGYKNRQFSTIRYNSDGSLDSGFGINGEVNSSIGSYSEIYDLSLQTNGQLIATGVSFNIDRQLITMARYTDLNLGTLDLNSSKNSILVYPNPIEKEATFQYTLQNNKAVSIELVDVQGKVVQNIITNQNQNAGLQLISLTLNDSILTGNYFLKITSSKGSQAVQIIKK